MSYELQIAKIKIVKIGYTEVVIEAQLGEEPVKRLTLLEGDDLIITMPFGLEPKITREHQENLPG